MIWTIVIALLILRALGLAIYIAGNLIHLLLVITAAVMIYKFVSNRRLV